MDSKKLKKKILEEGRVSLELKKRAFPGKGFADVRNWCEENGIDRHIPLELHSTEIAIVTPDGILMEVRAADNGQLGMWGGVIKDDETPLDGAIREVAEETGIQLTGNQLESAGEDVHYHKYANGDQVMFRAYRYIVKLDYVPETKLSNESKAATLVRPILSHQRSFIEGILYPA